MRSRIPSISSNMKHPHLAKILITRPNIGARKTVGKTGKLDNNHVVLTENVVKQIIYINKLNLPDVLIDIIKDYLYYSCDVVLHRKLTKELASYSVLKGVSALIGETDQYTYEYHIDYCIREPYPGLMTGYGYGDGYYDRDMLVKICTLCGNYTNDYMYEDESYCENVICKCNDNPFYQERDQIQRFYIVP